MGSNIYKYKVVFVIGAFAAIFFMLRISKWVSQIKVLSKLAKHLIYLSRNSIDIVIWHFLAFRLTIILQILVIGIGVKEIVAFPVYDASGYWWILYLLSGLYGSLVWTYILKNNPYSNKMKKMGLIT